VLGLSVALMGSVAALAGSYLLVLTAAAATQRSRHATMPAFRLAVIVPAHNEESVVAQCIASIWSQSYPRHMFRVLVVADNCSDHTAEVAAREGAEVLVRDAPDARGKGHALRYAIDHVGSWQPRPDAAVFIDADSVAEPNLLRALAAEHSAGADSAQADYFVLNPGSDPVRAAALLLFNRIRSQGRQALGLPAQLLGNGMLIRLSVLDRLPWRAFSPAEDLEYSLALQMAGFKVSFTSDGRVLGPLPPNSQAATTQRLRWEGGRLDILRTHWRAMAGCAWLRKDATLLESLLGLAFPPLSVLGLIVAAGFGAAGILALSSVISWWALLPWAMAASALAGHVIWGLRIGHAPAGVYRGLLRAPLFVAWKLTVYARLARGGFDPARWDRTARSGELGSERR
jgi:1,2-diacylglycerol 3-beta-glucosyltransferase